MKNCKNDLITYLSTTSIASEGGLWVGSYGKGKSRTKEWFLLIGENNLRLHTERKVMGLLCD
jgi:hypothetical protein